jgi:protein-S-isoprenylcysteine O-methyltransferase Ste14
MSRWFAPLLPALLFLLAHVTTPGELARLSNRHGWANGRPGPWNRSALVLVVVGLAGAVWVYLQHYRASPGSFRELQPPQKLLTPGLYAFSRNPSYVAALLLWLGWALYYGSLPVLFGLLAWWVLFDCVFVPWEERDLERRFGEAYRRYKQVVPRWLGKPGLPLA